MVLIPEIVTVAIALVTGLAAILAYFRRHHKSRQSKPKTNGQNTFCAGCLCRL